MTSSPSKKLCGRWQSPLSCGGGLTIPTTTPNRIRPGAAAAISALCSPPCSALTITPPSPPSVYPALSSKLVTTPGTIKSGGRPERTTLTRVLGNLPGPSLSGTHTLCCTPGIVTRIPPASRSSCRACTEASSAENIRSHADVLVAAWPFAVGAAAARWASNCWSKADVSWLSVLRRAADPSCPELDSSTSPKCALSMGFPSTGGRAGSCCVVLSARVSRATTGSRRHMADMTSVSG